MDKKEFFEKVAQMRQQQKAFFNAKPSSQERKDALIASKALEREIDQEIERVNAVLAKKDIYLIQYQDIDGTIASYLVEGFDIETQDRNGYMVANITKQIITYNGNMHPLNWVAKMAGIRGDHRLDKAITTTNHKPRKRGKHEKASN